MYGIFRSTKEAITTFVFTQVIAHALSANSPETLNIQQQYTTFLSEKGFSKLRAEEEAEKQVVLIKQRLIDVLAGWRELGLPSPLEFDQSGEVLLTWKHKNYESLTGYLPLSLSFVEIYEWLSTLDPRSYLLPAVIFLMLIGCDPIFVTDGPKDAGVDCIGRIANGPLRSILLFVQVKTQQADQGVLSKESLYQEYGKYAALPKLDKYREYLQALKFDEIRDGAGTIYVIESNTEFGGEAQVAAKNLGIVLRSKRQLAFFLSGSITIDKLKKAANANLIPGSPDLGTNLVPRLAAILQD